MFYKVDSHLTSLASSKFFERYGGPSPLARRTQMPPLRYGRADSPSMKSTTTRSSVDTGCEPKYENDVSTNNEMLNICNSNIQYNNKVVNKYSPEYYYKYKKNKNIYNDDNNPSDRIIILGKRRNLTLGYEERKYSPN